jgi:predicted MFS family arabinose efflux permease
MSISTFPQSAHKLAMADLPLQRRPSQTVLTLGLGAGQTLAFASSFYLMGVLGDAIAADLAIKPSLVSGMMSLAFLASALMAPTAGRWIEARGGKQVLLLSNLVFAAGLGLIGLSPNGVVVAAGLSVIGVGMALGLYGTPFAILVSLYGEGARRPITGVSLIGSLGSSLGWPLTLWFEQHLGWRGACFAWATVHLFICLPLSSWIVPHVAGGARHEDAEAPVEPVRWDRRMIQMAVLFSCAWFISTAMSTHLPRLLVASGLTPAKAAGTAALVGLAAMSVRLAEFTVLRRFAPLMATRVATLMHPLGALFLLVLGPVAAPALALGQGAGNGILTVAKGVLPLSLFGSAGYAYRSALLSRPAQFAQIGGPVLYGLVLERSAHSALALSSGLCLLMFAMSFGLDRRPSPVPKELPA